MMRASGQASRTDGDDNSSKNEVTEEHGKALRNMAQKVEKFVGGQGDIEGARFME